MLTQKILNLFHRCSPTPRVTWTRLGGNMPDTARMDKFGTELVIENIQLSHAGSYECSGINEEAQEPTRRSFTIVVEGTHLKYVINPFPINL